MNANITNMNKTDKEAIKIVEEVRKKWKFFHISVIIICWGWKKKGRPNGSSFPSHML